MKSPIKQPYQYSTAKLSNNLFPKYPDILSNYRWDNPKATDELEIFCVSPVSIKADKTIIVDDKIKVLGKGTITVDFGSEYAAWLEVDIPQLKGEITFGISEYNEPAIVNEGPKSPIKTQIPVQYHNTYRLELNDELYEGVRFGFINITDFKEEFIIENIRLVCQTKPVNYNGSFYSDNELLNSIWYNGAYGIRTNLKKDYFSAILMDRGDRHSWTGDAYPAQDGALTAFGNYDFIYHNLVYTSTSGNDIPSYELYWIFSLINYYRYTGDKEGIIKLIDQITFRLDIAIDNFDKEINLVFFGWDERLGAGFENPNTPFNKLSYRFLTIRALRVCLLYFSDLISPKYQEILKSLLCKIELNDLDLHSAADAINADLLNEEQIKYVYDKYFTDRVNRLSYSPFNEYFILQAMAKVNKQTDALDCILDMYGGQVKYGATCFFETYRPCWNDELDTLSAPINNQAGFTSLNHPWGNGVIHFINEEVLGIKPIQPGFKEFNIHPHTCSQLKHIRGTTPTPFGIISAEFDSNNGFCRFSIPKGTIGNIAIPKFGKSLKVDFNYLSEDKEYIYLYPLTDGEYEFKTSYFGDVANYKQNNYIYRAHFLGENLKSSYGEKGYYINQFNNSIPSYVKSISPCKESITDCGVLTADNEHCFNQTFTIDIDLKKESMITLYFKDYDKQNRRQAVEMFDLGSLELISPVKVIENFSNGIYLSFSYNKSIRFRINQIRGINAVLNGIYFD